MMLRFVSFSSMLVMLFVFQIAVTTAKEPVQQKDVICNKLFKVTSLDGKKSMVGYRLRVVENKAEKRIEILERWALKVRGEIVMLSSTVYLNNTHPYRPIVGATETKIGKKTCMTGKVTFAENSIDKECTGFLNKRDGTEIKPPKKFKQKGWPLPTGTLVFQSALPAIGPRILPKAGELQEVVFIEFPDDIGAPELITFKNKYRLVRNEPNENGEYTIELYRKDEEESLSSYRFNKNGTVISMELFGKMKIIEIPPKKEKIGINERTSSSFEKSLAVVLCKNVYCL